MALLLSEKKGWDRNVLLHEWSYPTADRPQVQISELGEVSYEQEPTENVTTWVYDEGSYTPIAKLINGERYSIVSDYLGRPVQCFDDKGEIIWETDYDLYDRLKNEAETRSTNTANLHE